MGDLADDQARFAAVLQQGPSAFPEGLFAGDTQRVLLGLKAHANTISHARLVAIEQTYPRTLAHIGHEAFNALSRAFIDQPHVRQRKLMAIGAGFADFLADQTSDLLAAELALVEWAWLESYHSADAAALQLADLAQYDEAGLLALPVMIHPATRLVAIGGPVADLLPELAAIDSSPASILITRPDEAVHLQSLDERKTAIAKLVKNCVTMGNLLQAAIETQGEAGALAVIFALIEAGVLARPEG